MTSPHPCSVAKALQPHVEELGEDVGPQRHGLGHHPAVTVLAGGDSKRPRQRVLIKSQL